MKQFYLKTLRIFKKKYYRFKILKQIINDKFKILVVSYIHETQKKKSLNRYLFIILLFEKMNAEYYTDTIIIF